MRLIFPSMHWFLTLIVIQVNLCQKHSFLNLLTHNMTTHCSLIYNFSTRKIQVQNMMQEWTHELSCNNHSIKNKCPMYFSRHIHIFVIFILHAILQWRIFFATTCTSYKDIPSTGFDESKERVRCKFFGLDKYSKLYYMSWGH